MVTCEFPETVSYTIDNRAINFSNNEQFYQSIPKCTYFVLKNKRENWILENQFVKY